jgi:hypothetical protein
MTALSGGSSAAPASVFAQAGPLAGAQYYLHGLPEDQAYKSTGLPDDNHVTFKQIAPDQSNPVNQTTTSGGNENFVANQALAYWSGPFSGTITDNIKLEWYWSTPNADATVQGAEVTVSVFADPDYAATGAAAPASRCGSMPAPSPTSGTGRVQPQKLIGRATVNLGAVGPTPALATSYIPVCGTVNDHLLIQVAPRFLNTGNGLIVHYDHTSTPSRFTVDAPTPLAPAVNFDNTTSLEFAPSTVVSANFLGAEPQTTIERPFPGAPAGVTDPTRVFVDWPLGSTSHIGQLSRSLDGGSSFRLLLNDTCAVRQRPNCATSGGGDTENEVNLVNGHLFFSDQEAVANEALASSTDHGDTFPPERDHALSNTATAVDRQWLSWVDPAMSVTFAPGTPASTKLTALLAYHLPIAGQFIQGVDQTGNVIPQPVPQLAQVTQSGSLRVDNSDGPGRGWIYQAYKSTSGYNVAVAPVSKYWDPTQWKVNNITGDQPTIFPWLNLDSHGNAYAVWVSGGVAYYSFSAIDDPLNDPTNCPTPTTCGRPGTHWSAKVRVSKPGITSAVFPEVTAGDPGRVAITYMGTEFSSPAFPGGVSDTAPLDADWDVYAAVLTNAMGEGGQPINIVTGKVNHRVVHTGSICTSGTACTGDRSLLDMTDIGVDSAGRVGVVFMDNNGAFHGGRSVNVKDDPFTEFAKQTAGPSLNAANPVVSITIPEDSRGDGTQDAYWPNNTQTGAQLPSLDATGASLGLDGTDLVARLPLIDASGGRMATDLTTFTTKSPSQPPGERLQYVIRFETAQEKYHMSMEYLANGTKRFFGGKLDANDALYLADQSSSPVVALGKQGAAYHTDTNYPVTGTIEGNTLVLRAPVAQFGLSAGSHVVNVTGLTMAGPNEASEKTILNPMRTVDAVPPFNATLVAAPPTTTTTVPTATTLPGATTTTVAGGTTTTSTTVPPSTTTTVPYTGPKAFSLTLSPDEGTNDVGEIHSYTALVVDEDGNPMSGVPVAWTSTGSGTFYGSEPKTDENGQARASVTSETPGDQQVTASAPDCQAGSDCSDTSTQHWIGSESKCDVRGSRGPDRLIGTDGPETICGYGGNDILIGYGDDDVLLGGSGRDLLRAGPGADQLRGAKGPDNLLGGRGKDLIRGVQGWDTLRGMRANDRLRGGSGNDDLRGGTGSDRLSAKTGDDFLDGGEGRDTCNPGRGIDEFVNCEGRFEPSGSSGRSFVTSNWNGKPLL